jgi:hypothetical protein
MIIDDKLLTNGIFESFVIDDRNTQFVLDISTQTNESTSPTMSGLVFDFHERLKMEDRHRNRKKELFA